MKQKQVLTSMEVEPCSQVHLYMGFRCLGWDCPGWRHKLCSDCRPLQHLRTDCGGDRPCEL